MQGARVAIIGAGAAGLAAAVALRERRIHTIVVFEREPRVGGQCLSVDIDDRAYDLGASVTTARCQWVRHTAEQLGMTRRMVEGRRIVDVSGDSDGGTWQAGALQRLRLGGATSVYARIRRHARVDRIGYAEVSGDVAQSFGSWLRRHGLAGLQELFSVLCAVYGHGSLLALPAIYGLKLLDPIYVDAAVQRVLGTGEPDTMDFVEGYQELWERVVERYDLRVRTSTTIEKVRRGPSGVRVRGTGPGGAFDEHFDRLVLACPLDHALDFLDASPEEQRLFSQLRYRESWVTLARMRGAPHISTTVHPYALSAEPGQPMAFTPPVPGDDTLFRFRAHGGPGVTAPDVHRNIERLTRRPDIDGTVEGFAHTVHWRTFPHVDAEAIRAGFYSDVEALQGEFHTIYVGEALTFPLVELVAEYSRTRVEAHF